MKTTLVSRSLVILAVLLPALAYQTYRQIGISSSKELIVTDSLPESITGWQSKSVELTDDEKSMLKSPSASQRIYFNAQTGEKVQVLLLQVGNTQNAHDPKFCMTGSGYRIDSDDRITADWANRSHTPSEVSRALFSKESEKVVMFYWLQTPNGTLGDMSAGFKLEGIKRALKGEATKGIAIRIIGLTKQDNSGPTPEETVIKIWREIDNNLDIEQLVKGM